MGGGSGLWLVLAGVLLMAEAVHAHDLEGRVIKVSDGDTLEIQSERRKRWRVRIAAIDAPERDQSYGTQSGAHLRRLTLRKHVSVHDVRQDRHGRWVGQAWLQPEEGCPSRPAPCPGAVDLGLIQVQTGMAWHYRHYAREQSPDLRAAYAEAERRARLRRAGLWAASQPMPPWQWRHKTVGDNRP